MNEHDSERLAGLLEAEGLVATDTAEDADVVILNTCCIRENADNRLYGNLGQLRALKQRRPGMQIAVGGCLAQKDRERSFATGAVGRRRLRDAQRRSRRTISCARPNRKARSSKSSMRPLPKRDEFPSALPVHRELPVRGLGHHPGRAATTTAPFALSRPCGAVKLVVPLRKSLPRSSNWPAEARSK